MSESLGISAAGDAERQEMRAAKRERIAERKARKKAARREEKRAKNAKKFQNRPFVQRRVVGLMRFVLAWARAVGRVRASNVAGRVARTVGPLARENRLGARNIAAAFPDKTKAECDAILSGVWDNLGRQLIEYAYMQDLIEAFDPDHLDQGPFSVDGLQHLYALRDSGRPGIIFGAHIGNWELTAGIGGKLGLAATALYRAPKNAYLAEEMEKRRGEYIDTLVASGRGAAMRVANALRNGRNVGILIDQRIAEGEVIPFFGRPSLSNPAVGILARLFDCPVHGAYALRRPGGRFDLMMTPPLDLPRDSTGRVDAHGTNVLVHATVEQWVRENPEQWLWLHDRWRYGRRKHGHQF